MWCDGWDWAIACWRCWCCCVGSFSWILQEVKLDSDELLEKDSVEFTKILLCSDFKWFELNRIVLWIHQNVNETWVRCSWTLDDWKFSEPSVIVITLNLCCSKHFIKVHLNLESPQSNSQLSLNFLILNQSTWFTFFFKQFSWSTSPSHPPQRRSKNYFQMSLQKWFCKIFNLNFLVARSLSAFRDCGRSG